MTKLTLLLLTILIGAPNLYAKGGWVRLFNGRNLSGWTQKSGGDKFFVADGCIVGQAVAESDTNSVLCTRKDYDNFILELDFKTDRQLFCGIHIRGQYAATNTPWQWDGRALTIPRGHAYGYLVLIDPGPNHRWWTATLLDQRWWTGGVYDEWRRMWLYPGLLGGNADAFSKQGRRIFNLTNWNHLRIEAAGDTITTYVNGALCAHLHDSMNATGFIGLQLRDWISDDDHQILEGAKAYFKNIRLKRLPAPVREAAFAGGGAAGQIHACPRLLSSPLSGLSVCCFANRSAFLAVAWQWRKNISLHRANLIDKQL